MLHTADGIVVALRALLNIGLGLRSRLTKPRLIVIILALNIGISILGILVHWTKLIRESARGRCIVWSESRSRRAWAWVTC